MTFNTTHADFSWRMELLMSLSGNKTKLSELAVDFNVTQERLREWIEQLPGYGIDIASLGHHSDGHGFVVTVDPLYRKRVDRESDRYFRKVYGEPAKRARPRIDTRAKPAACP